MSEGALSAPPVSAVTKNEGTRSTPERKFETDKKSTAHAAAIAGIRDTAEGEKFIPVSQFDLLRRLAQPDGWPGHDPKHVEAVFNALTRWRNLGYSDQLDRLTEHYLPFDPDADVSWDGSLSASLRADHQRKLFEELTTLIKRANYDEITQEELDWILAESSPTGVEVQVDLSDFEEQMLYARAATLKELWVRDWRWLFLRKKCYHVPVFERLFLALKFKSSEMRVAEMVTRDGIPEAKARKIVARDRAHLPDGISPDHIYLKLFKCIPQVDLEMLFPNTRVRLKYIDKIKLWITGGGGGVVGLFAAVPKIVASVATITVNPLNLMVALGGLIAVFFRQVMNFFNTRNKYMMQLAQNLYFQSLAHNRGVLTLLIDRAEEEDIKEDALLYALLAKESMRGEEIGDARLAVEQFLAQEFGVAVRYDIEEAIGRLMRDGLLVESSDGVIRALPPLQAWRRLQQLWSEALSQDFAPGAAAA